MSGWERVEWAFPVVAAVVAVAVAFWAGLRKLWVSGVLVYLLSVLQRKERDLYFKSKPFYRGNIEFGVLSCFFTGDCIDKVVCLCILSGSHMVPSSVFRMMSFGRRLR